MYQFNDPDDHEYENEEFDPDALDWPDEDEQ